MNERPNPAADRMKKPKKSKKKWQKVTLTILKYIRVPVLFLAMAVVGLWIGYVKLGKQSMGDMLHWSTWKHIFDLIFAN
ncbi:DNA-directed RNA polymerase subunit beta [Paenibacillus radicibacter]|uniref:DNA-directed RNA polymerase subunit beta n=1 Tax=Paenibacillus radicibacter TaxID=2972488 RepID=UPI0021590295|nr:DNA-directed RNA polymerase subunit beta [Paenibacillus radicibacter]